MVAAPEFHTRFSHPCHNTNLQDTANIKITPLKWQKSVSTHEATTSKQSLPGKTGRQSQAKVSTGLSYRPALTFNTKGKMTTSVLHSMTDTAKAALVDGYSWFYKMSVLWQRSHCQTRPAAMQLLAAGSHSTCSAYWNSRSSHTEMIFCCSG